MRVYVGDYKMAIVLIIMGAIMCISSACAAKRFYEELFATGICIIVIGILAWIWFHVQYPGAKRPVRKEAQPPSVRVRAPPSPSAIPQYRS